MDKKANVPLDRNFIKSNDSSELSEKGTTSYLKIVALLVIIVAINAFFDATFQLHFDEAYYWVWGQNLSLSYFDHPPMIAYMLWLTNLFGHSEFWVRLPALVTTTITIITIYALAKKMFDTAVANVALIIAIACPLIEGVFFVITPDSPLLMFWTLSLYTFYLAIDENNNKYIYITGILIGCALLSKYTAVLLFPGFFLFLLTTPKYRHYLVQKEVYLACIIALIVFSPVIIWNYQHHWVSFIYQIHHGVGQINTHNDPWTWQDSGISLANYFGGDALIAGPILFLAMLYYALRYLKTNVTDSKLAFLFWQFFFGLMFFACCSLTTWSNANWPGPCYISAIILLSWWVVKMNRAFIYRLSLGLILFIMLVAKLPLVFIPHDLHDRIPLNTFYGNREFFAVVKPYITPDTIILGCDYGNASRAWYYLDAKRTYVLPDFPFASGYRYWQQPPVPLKHAIYLCDNKNDVAGKVLAQYFKHIRLLKIVTFSNAITDKHSYIYQVSN